MDCRWKLDARRTVVRMVLFGILLCAGFGKGFLWYQILPRVSTKTSPPGHGNRWGCVISKWPVDLRPEFSRVFFDRDVSSALRSRSVSHGRLPRHEKKFSVSFSLVHGTRELTTRHDRKKLSKTQDASRPRPCRELSKASHPHLFP